MRMMLRVFILSLLAVLLAACGTATAASNLRVYARYADNLQTVDARANPTQFPNPWQGASNVNFKGSGDRFDTGVIRIENTSGAMSPLTRSRLTSAPSITTSGARISESRRTEA